MSFPKFSEWVLIKEQEQQAPMQSSVPGLKTPGRKIDPKTQALIKDKIAKASPGGKFNKNAFVSALKGDTSIDPQAMINALGGDS